MEEGGKFALALIFVKPVRNPWVGSFPEFLFMFLYGEWRKRKEKYWRRMVYPLEWIISGWHQESEHSIQAQQRGQNPDSPKFCKN